MVNLSTKYEMHSFTCNKNTVVSHKNCTCWVMTKSLNFNWLKQSLQEIILNDFGHPTQRLTQRLETGHVIQVSSF